MPKRVDLKKVMVIGSGPIIIGQAAEFDYAGSQACRALKEEGIKIVLANSNPATIMTDTNMADKVYMEPLTPSFVAQILRKEKPDGLLPTLGGQVGLNIAMELAHQGVLAETKVQLLGTPLETIQKAEDREKFKQMLEQIGEPVPPSIIVTTFEEAQEFVKLNGYPIIVRPAYTLGGTGGGMAKNQSELEIFITRGLKSSIINQVLIEKSIAGWKEIEFEVIRDSADNCITVCSMENIDPIGIHTGDSIVVAPTQTLSQPEYQMLRDASLKIIRALEIEGGCNVQFALNPASFEYAVIEVNPRISRSSALASKATGYPIAKIVTKIAIGLHLDEISSPVTQKTYACSEPILDYCVIKIPRWPFDKFVLANRQLGTQMKATGEVMALGRSFEAALLKAIRSLEIGITDLNLPELGKLSHEALIKKVRNVDDERLFAIAEALRRGVEEKKLASLTGIDIFFIHKISGIIKLENELSQYVSTGINKIPLELMRRAKNSGMGDAAIAKLLKIRERDISYYRNKHNLHPTYKKIDTCAGEFEASTSYYYSTYEDEDEVKTSSRKKVIVLGSGPIRIGQGIEFDYCSVHSAWALQEEGLESIIINNNPETVSTDFDTSDRLYFEPLMPEDVLEIVKKEKSDGVIVQFGGQTSINLAKPLAKAGIKILGTTVEDIDQAEDRDKFDRILEKIEMLRPPGSTAISPAEAATIAEKIGYPVLVRPSYVLGGRAMEIVYNKDDLKGYMDSAIKVSPHHPVLIDKYFKGIELEVDVVSDGKNILIPGIMEHIERAGVHSGDSIALYPPKNISPKITNQVIDYTKRLAQALRIRGILNIQYVVYNNNLFVIEVNPRSSRTVPFISKVTGIPLINIATKVIIGYTLKELGYDGGLYPEQAFYAVKAPVFSFSKLSQLEISLGPEMKSTGEVIGIDQDLPHALYKALSAAGFNIPAKGNILITIADKDKKEALPLIKKIHELGFHLLATKGTANFLNNAGLAVKKVNKIREGSPHIIDSIQSGKIDVVINTLTKGKTPERDGFRIRRAAVDHNIPCLTSLDTAKATWKTLKDLKEGKNFTLRSLQDYLIKKTAETPE